VTGLLEECPQCSVLEVGGTLRAPIDGKLRRDVETLLGRGERQILVNLARLSDIDAAGIGELMAAYHETKAVGGDLRIARPTRRIQQLLDVAGVLRILSPA